MTPPLTSYSTIYSTEARCQIPKSDVTGLARPGDVLLGALIPLLGERVAPENSFNREPAKLICRGFRFQNYQWLQAIVFAIDEINRNPDFLPNATLGLWMFDTCSAVSRALEGSIWILTQSGKSVPNYRCQRKAQVAGIIGDYSSTNTISMARLLGLSRYPQVSYFSTSSILSDRSQFPSFFRTIPSDDFQSRGLAQLVIHFGWTWVGLLAMDNDYGQQGILILRQELANAGVCIAFSENILTALANKNALHIVRVIRSSSAKAIVIFSNEASLLPIVEEMVVQNVTGRTWIASESWSTFALLSIAKYQPVLSGTIGFAMRSGEIPWFNPDSIHPSNSPDDIFGAQLWEKAFDCKWPNQKNPLILSNNTITLCTGNETLDNLQIRNNSTRTSTAAYSAYGSVYAIASALKDLKSCETSRGPFHHGTCADVTDFQPWQLLHYVQNVRFRNADGAEVSFDQHGNPTPWYDIVNWQRDAWGNIQYIKVGRYDASAPQKLLVNTTAIVWAGGNTQIPLSLCSPICPPGFWKASKLGEPACCFMCVPCPQGEMSNQSDSVTCSKCPWDQWPNERQDQCIPKTIEFLSYYEPLGAALAVISVGLSLIPSGILVMFIHFRKTPIVKANNRSLSYLLLFALALCFLTSLFFIGFPSAEKCLLRQAAFGIIFALCISCVLAKTIMVVIAFKAINPKNNLRRWVGRQLAYVVVTICTLIQVLLCVAWLSYLPAFSEYNTYSQPGNIIIECIEGSPIAFWCMLGYLGFLATISFIVAFLSRKLPDSFNEAKFITFSMLAFLVAWISFIPAYLSTRGKYMVAMEIFTILSSSSALVSCIFFPKCYIILLRPEINTKEFLVGRGRGSTYVT